MLLVKTGNKYLDSIILVSQVIPEGVGYRKSAKSRRWKKPYIKQKTRWNKEIKGVQLYYYLKSLP